VISEVETGHKTVKHGEVVNDVTKKYFNSSNVDRVIRRKRTE